MSTTTPNLGLFKYDPSTDGAQTFNIKQGLNDNWDKIDAAVKSLSSAAEYSSAQTYALGDYCTHDGKLYRCTTAITEAEAWTDSHWTETSVSAELKAIYTALQNKAPAGYGFGQLPSVLTDPDSLDGTVDGIYHFYNSDNPIEGNDAGILVHYQGNLISVSGQSKQIFYPGIQHNSHLERIFTGGWKPWEWVNPPMALGVEYRTTERWNGKPVYALLYQFDALPNGEGRRYGVRSGVDQIISISPHMVHSGGSKFAGVIPGLQSYWAGVSASGGDMYIAVETTKDLSGYTAYFLVKYTKV